MTRATFITDENIDLIILETSDAEVMQAWMNDQAVTAYLSRGVWPMYQKDELAWLESLPKENHLVLGIWHKADGQLIGSCGLHEIDHKNQTTELGIVIGEPKYWGGGYGSRAVTLLVQHGFNWLNLRHVTLRVFGNNPRAQRCYEKCRFVRTGIIPEHIFIDGEWQDEIHMLCDQTTYNLSEQELVKRRFNHIVKGPLE